MTHRFRNKTDINFLVEACNGSGNMRGGKIYVTGSELRRGVVMQQMQIGNATYKVRYEVA
jgi:hypothetical protein